MKKLHAAALARTAIALGAAVLAAAGLAFGLAYYLTRDDRAPWTTRSKAAGEEFEKGLEAFTREYRAEAGDHFRRALELDPDFVAAKLYLSWLYVPGSPDRAEELVAEIRAADLEGLSARERFLASYWLAFHDGRHAEAEAVLDAFLALYPTDPFGLQARCERAWDVEDWPAAQECYERLVELHPNRVRAYEHLGFIAMAQGRFTAAEESFLTYRYIAPDQAQPHVALAELLSLLGRYREAEASLERALAIKDDFCPALRQLVRVYAFAGRHDDASAALERMAGAEACADLERGAFYCRARAQVAFFRGDLEGAWQQVEGDCLERLHGFDVIAHHVAVATGRLAAAVEMTRRLDEIAAQMRQAGPGTRAWFAAARAHVEGVQRMAGGDYGAAAELLRQVDEGLPYWTAELSAFKLLNRLFLARSLELTGEVAEARAVRKKLEAVNPRFAQHLPELDFLKRGG
jgi:tetratricopeptide (TPR) repeat protein